MRFLVFVFVAVELLQVVVIAMLVVGYRNLQRKVEGDFRFAERPPRSVTED
ncbi:MAG TPA: hypothetical protein VE360_07695 [Pyrinomonadaceae bacterium]|jgi:hypothetical protein|nr:hypothetical protein [Pyrinomonadaceae bacterium]